MPVVPQVVPQVAPKIASAPPPLETPPGPRARPWRVPGALARDPLSYLENLPRRYGDVAAINTSKFRATFVNHPDLIQTVLVTDSRSFMKGEGLQRAKRLLGEGLLTSEGDLHHRQRRLLQPVFLNSRIHSYAAAMGEHTMRHTGSWLDGQKVDMAREMASLTLAVVAQTLFSADITREAAEIGAALDTAIQLFNSLGSPLTPLYDLLPFGPSRKFRNAKEKLDHCIGGLIAARRSAGESAAPTGQAAHEDLLSVLLETRYDDGSGMDALQIRDEAMTIFLAGHETTANALAWTWYLLAGEPKVQLQLHREARGLLAGRAPRFEDLEHLPYAKMVVAESMRLFPPAWIIGRRALSDVVLQHEGHCYEVPRGSLVVMSQWTMHRDARYWTDPERFNPDRWLPEAISNRPRFAYFPFGAGPRQCIGEGFARMEAVLLLAGMAQDWRAELADEANVTPQPRITLRPVGLKMRLRRWPGSGRIN